MLKRVRWSAASLAIAALSLPVSAVHADDIAEPQNRTIQIEAHVHNTEESPGYWIGIQSAEIDAALQTHLGLEDGYGLVVSTVVPDSPAAAAGLEPLDILLSLAGVSVEDPTHLSELVQEAEGEAVDLEIIRRGERQSLSITPVAWDNNAAFLNPSNNHSADAHIEFETHIPEEAQIWIERLQEAEGNNGEGGVRSYRFFHEGAIIPSEDLEAIIQGHLEANALPALPEGVDITITAGEEGANGNARITLTRDGETIDITEETLSELPEEIQSYFQDLSGENDIGLPADLLRHLTVDDSIENARSIRVFGAVHPRFHEGAADASSHDAEILQRLDMLQNDLDALRQAIELRGASNSRPSIHQLEEGQPRIQMQILPRNQHHEESEP